MAEPKRESEGGGVAVVRTSTQPWAEVPHQGRFQQRRKHLGGERLSCGLWELPPGKKSFPLHVHHCTEEALFVISGCGQVRTPGGLTAVGPGDFVSFPAGGPAHQLVNDGTEPLVYVAMAAVGEADVVEYPDGDKVGVLVRKGAQAGKRFLFRPGAQVGYYDGEPDA
ncbi:MAG: cupin domain-containing protein [Deltaproteobacteria bacterium]|nr:cupin domain-containing protein [Deltaproteobacteria bacterium]